jgi:hypothetical protein
MLISALPLLDLLFAVIRRLRGQVSPCQGDRFHFYDLLLARGFSSRQVVLLCYGITAAFAIIGSSGVRHDSTEIRIAAACSVALFTLVAIRLGSLRPNDGDRQMQSVLASQSKERAESAS